MTVEPFEAAVSRLLDVYVDVAVPLPPSSRTRLVAELVGVYCEHRVALVSLLSDLSSRWAVPMDPRVAGRVERILVLLAGEEPSNDDRVVVDAVLGVITRPLLDPATDTGDERTRRLIVAMALDVAKRLGNEASRSWSARRRLPGQGR